jgi:hypothetical protein
MRPWQHAKSTAGRNGDWREHLPIHEFLDSTKLASPDLRHRMILHNVDLGPAVVALAFPERKDSRAIAVQHVREDLDGTPSLLDWIATCDVTKWPHPPYRRGNLEFDSIVRRIVLTQGLNREDDVRAVLHLLLLPLSFAGPIGLCVFFNSFGPALVRRVMGEPRGIEGRHREVVFDPAHAAESLIYWTFGSIPDLNDVVLTSNALTTPVKTHV